ncbi:COMM domain-containing protein 7 isoform X2 [Alligator sinensis]|uniref:COMM domain-containing protein 7 isoform X2 n=1 Tax=Alligator sinensis TaxID=38654 RepID=A0A3Q0HC40_ALLSI|nr:COMM domain-containing protein 7 isoform X2 [Alligator sinensis]
MVEPVCVRRAAPPRGKAGGQWVWGEGRRFVPTQPRCPIALQQFSALTEVLFRFLTEPKEVERFLTQLSEFAATNKISLGPLKNIVKSLLLVPNGLLVLALENGSLVKLRRAPCSPRTKQAGAAGACYVHTLMPAIQNTAGALKRNLSSEEVKADFIALGLSEEKASYFAEQWKLNSPTLTSLAVGQTLMINQLIDMEWKFGVTAGSSELEKVGSIFLQLKLVVKKGNHTEPVYVELTLPQFYSFLHEMERVKTSLECFS